MLWDEQIPDMELGFANSNKGVEQRDGSESYNS